MTDRHKAAFVGRAEELVSFRANLSREAIDAEKWFVLNVVGQGGTGKTTLLQEMQRSAAGQGWGCGWADDSDGDVLSVLTRVAKSLDAGGVFAPFLKHVRRYNERCHLLESDPQAPLGLAAALGRNVGIASVRLGRRAPGVGVAFDYVDERVVGDQTSELFAFISRKVASADDLELLKRPLAVLTPQFLDAVADMPSKGVALFFDTYERTGHFLDEWIRMVLADEYGPAPTNVLFLIAGRDDLDHADWAQFNALRETFRLDAFDRSESQQYLAQRGISDRAVIDQIISVSHGLPVLVAMLASQAPHGKVRPFSTDPAGTAVDLFLKWVGESDHRRIALVGAIPRRLNRDVLNVINSTYDDETFAWLTSQPFVLGRSDGWSYHLIVRRLMMLHLQRESPSEWRAVHESLERHYTDQLRNCYDEMSGTFQAGWMALERERIYHRLAYDESEGRRQAIERFFSALHAGGSDAMEIAQALAYAEEDFELSGRSWGRHLQTVIERVEEARYEAACDAIGAVLAGVNDRWLSERAEVTARRVRASLHLDAGQGEAALEDLAEVERHGEMSASVLYQRASVYASLESYRAAMRDLNRARSLLVADDSDTGHIDVFAARVIARKAGPARALRVLNRIVRERPDFAWGWLNRGQVLLRLGRNGRARSDIERAISLNSGFEHEGYKDIGVSYIEEGRLRDADRSLCAALAAGPACDECWSSLAELYVRMHGRSAAAAAVRAFEIPRFSFPEMVLSSRGYGLESVGLRDDALADYGRAINAQPRYATGYFLRAQLLMQDEDELDAALRDFNRGLELEPRAYRALRLRGRCNAAREEHGDAMRDFDECLRIVPNFVPALLDKGRLLEEEGEFEEALKMNEMASRLDKDVSVDIASDRGLLLSYLGRYSDAVAVFDSILSADPDSVQASYNRAISASWGGMDVAEVARDHCLRRLLQLESDDAVAMYGKAGLDAVVGKAGAAVDGLAQALAIDGGVGKWARRDVAWRDLRDTVEFQTILLAAT